MEDCWQTYVYREWGDLSLAQLEEISTHSQSFINCQNEEFTEVLQKILKKHQAIKNLKLPQQYNPRRVKEAYDSTAESPTAEARYLSTKVRLCNWMGVHYEPAHLVMTRACVRLSILLASSRA